MPRVTVVRALTSFALPLAMTASLGACSSANPTPTSSDRAEMPGETVSPSSFVTVSSPASLPVQSSVADLADAVSPTVVNITTTDTVDRDDAPGFPGFEFLIPGRPSRRPRARIGAGTGFIIDGGGYVVTNAHVVSDADEVSVRLHDEREFAAEVVGRDAKIDLALLKIGGVTGLPAVTLGDSDTLRVGEHVLAVGNPFGLGHTVTMGIVSAKARSIGAGPYDDFIQTDASINPGNSGGPLFNLRGEVVGINTAIRAGADGIGFAIPVRVLKDIVEQLKQKGYVERGKLGLMFQPITPELASALGQDRPHGALVNDVMPNGPAARAGIQAGDVVVGVGDERLARAEELSRLVARHTPGSSLAVHLVRDGKKLTVHATLDKLEDREHTASRVPKPHAKPARELLPGIEIDDDPEGGVRVVGLTKPAHGLEPGDLIVEALGKPVGTVLELTRALENSTRRAALLKVRRDGKSRYVGVTLTR